MSLAGELLDQAEHLATLEKRGKPRQASLRRAVSAAYYALFHLLIDEAVTLLLPVAGPPELRSSLGSTFTHADIKVVCQAIASPPKKPSSNVDRLIEAIQPRPDYLVRLSWLFVALQAERHDADYDTAKRFGRQDVRRLIGETRDVFRLGEAHRSQPEAQRFLFTLIAWKRWDFRR